MKDELHGQRIIDAALRKVAMKGNLKLQGTVLPPDQILGKLEKCEKHAFKFVAQLFGRNNTPPTISYTKTNTHPKAHTCMYYDVDKHKICVNLPYLLNLVSSDTRANLRKKSDYKAELIISAVFVHELVHVHDMKMTKLKEIDETAQREYCALGVYEMLLDLEKTNPEKHKKLVEARNTAHLIDCFLEARGVYAEASFYVQQTNRMLNAETYRDFVVNTANQYCIGLYLPREWMSFMSEMKIGASPL